jgi:multidrug efflux pump subunit AcrA (membrane-fusion protein)
VVGGAVYYQTTVLFDKDYPDIRSGMTVNLNIETGSSTSALLVPASALTITATSTSVTVLVQKKPEVRTVATGLKSLDGLVEIIRGVNLGDNVIVGTN